MRGTVGRHGVGVGKCTQRETEKENRATCRSCSVCHMLPIYRPTQSILLNIRFPLRLVTPHWPLAISGPSLLNQLALHRAAESKNQAHMRSSDNIHGLFAKGPYNLQVHKLILKTSLR